MILSRILTELRAGTEPGRTMHSKAWRRAAITLMHAPIAVLLDMSDEEFDALGTALNLTDCAESAAPSGETAVKGAA
jgi:hypothetical protein